jgi:outer membrane protein assembly factor BamB
VKRLFLSALLAAAAVRAQGEWTTARGDAQGAAWVRTDRKISTAALEKGGFDLLWKLKLGELPMEPILVNNIIGYRGFKALAMVGTSGGSVFAVDSDLGKMYWQKHFDQIHAPVSAPCPGGMTAVPSRLTPIAPAARPGAFAAAAAAAAARPGRALGGAVGKPGEGVDGLDEMLAKIAAPPPPPRPATTPPPGAAQNAFGAISALYAISADGVVHSINIHNAADFEPPVPFLPAGARVSGFTVINLIAYAATSHGCGGGPDAVWSIDLGSADKTVKQWKLESGGESGDPALAFGSDGTVYVAAGNELTALDAKTLELKARFLGPSTAAVIFPYKGNDLVAAASRDAISLLDSKSFVLLDHGTAGASALATFDEADGARWLIASGANKLAAFKVVEKDGKPALEPTWSSRPIDSPHPPIVVNGVVFTASGATLYAFDALTGKDLWNSGKSIASPIRAGISAGDGKLFATSADGTLYTFGFFMEH